MRRGRDGEGGVVLEIRVLHRHGKSIREIAREAGVSRNTVRRYLRDEEAIRYKPRPSRQTKLDPFKGSIIERLRAAAPERFPASVLLMELRERGYSGGYTMLKVLMTSLRSKAALAPVIRFETGPGEQMQVDWAVIRRGSNRLSVFVAMLGWSRATYVEFVTDERVETLIAAHENAFLAFGGTPREVLYDNMRTVVLERHGYGRGRHRFIPYSSTSLGIAGSDRGGVRRIGRRPKARLSGSFVTCDRAFTSRSPAGSGKRASSSIGRPQTSRSNVGCARWRMLAFTAPPARSRLKDWRRKECSCSQSRRPTAGAACARSRPNRYRRRSWVSNICSRSTTPSLAAPHERLPAPSDPRSVSGITAHCDP